MNNQKSGRVTNEDIHNCWKRWKIKGIFKKSLLLFLKRKGLLSGQKFFVFDGIMFSLNELCGIMVIDYKIS